MSSYLPLLLVAHVILAVSLILPSILLPFALRTRRATTESGSPLVRWLLRAQTHGTLAIGLGLALTGIGLIAALGSTMLEQPWLLLALTTYFINLAAPARRRPRHGRRQHLAGTRPAAALRLVPDGRPGGHDRVPDELEAGALVTGSTRRKR
jgi:hypothetical protein